MLKMSPKPQSSPKTVRMEQRITRETKDLIELAARLQGINASEFVISHACIAARTTINQLESTKLSSEDRDAFMQAFDAEPTPELTRLMHLHSDVSNPK